MTSKPPDLPFKPEATGEEDELQNSYRLVPFTASKGPGRLPEALGDADGRGAQASVGLGQGMDLLNGMDLQGLDITILGYPKKP